MLLEILYTSLLLLNFIQASATFSPSSSLRNVLKKTSVHLHQRQHEPRFSSIRPITGLRGGSDDDIDEEDNILPLSLQSLVEDTISSERKIIVVTGGVLSGIGKGVTASSIGVLLRSMGLRVTALKIDPYLNVDAGTMSPFEHGEVFVLDDGGETDLDLGNYERFLSVSLTKESNLSTGKIYQVCVNMCSSSTFIS